MAAENTTPLLISFYFFLNPLIKYEFMNLDKSLFLPISAPGNNPPLPFFFIFLFFFSTAALAESVYFPAHAWSF